jgi:hypothetical protein
MACSQADEGEVQRSVADVGADDCSQWGQNFGTADHGGKACPELHGMQVLKTITQDPDADAEGVGFLSVHESSPLVSGDWVIVPGKTGFTGKLNRSRERWNIVAYRWTPSVSAPDAELVPVWKLETNWQPVDSIVRSLGFVTNGYVAQFGPALANGSVYFPSAAGTITRVDLETGGNPVTINPFKGKENDGDVRSIVTNALSVGHDGSIYYGVVAWPTAKSPTAGDPTRGEWLVNVRPDNGVRVVPWARIASASVGVPQEYDLCEWPFGTNRTQPPTGPDSRPPQFSCGKQRPAMNAPFAIDSAGDLTVFSYSNNAQGAAFLIKVNAVTLTPVWAADTRGHLTYGCGVRIPVEDSILCQILTANGTTNLGVDSEFNSPVRFSGEDLMDSAPTIAPNGDTAIGSYDGGFSFGGGYDARGGAVVFDRNGRFASKNEDFFWEVTASVLRHGSTFSYLQDRQLYSLALDGDESALGVAQYSSAFDLETLGGIPLNLDPVAIDWLDAHVVFGAGGDHYGVNGSGIFVKFSADGTPVDSVDLLDENGDVLSMETLSNYSARDSAGRIYASYAGRVFVIASSGGPDRPPTADRLRPSAALIAGKQAKMARAAEAATPRTLE